MESWAWKGHKEGTGSGCGDRKSTATNHSERLFTWELPRLSQPGGTKEQAWEQAGEPGIGDLAD